MTALKQLGGPTWFQLGDRDLAMHLQRSRHLEQGDSLTSVTARICTMLGIRVQVIPMSDDPVATRVNTTEGELSFQEYFVGRQCEPAVSGFRFDGAAQAHANPAALAALRDPALRAVVICPSNPFVSIDPILAVPGMRDALLAASAPIIAVTPIIGGRAVKGPAAKMMAELGMPCSANEVAAHYAGLADAFVLDHADEPASRDDRIGGGPRVFGAQTLMRSVDDRRLLATSVLSIADRLLENMP
jgi:LPPG:FO 2-phospho-L-lactate transferase